MLAFAGVSLGACVDDIKEINTTKVFRNHIKENLFSFLQNPTESSVNLTEINATLYFYVSFPIINSSIICNESGDLSKYNGINISLVTKKFIDNPDRNVIPRCSDGTLYGECSARVPYYCLSGKLVPMCAGFDDDNMTLHDNCACPENATCIESTGQCDIECLSDGECQVWDTYSCNGQRIMRDTISQSCINNRCVNQTLLPVEIDNCGPQSLNCYDGMSTCAQCQNDGHCLPSDSYECNGSVIVNQYCQTTCQNNLCVVNASDCSPIVGQDCSQEPPTPFCIDGLMSCGECSDDSDCPDTTSNEYCWDGDVWGLVCERDCDNSSNVTTECMPLGCNNQTIDNCTDDVVMDEYDCNAGDLRQLIYEDNCQPGASPSCGLDAADFVVINSCSLQNETCIDNCSRCYDTTTPRNDVSKPPNPQTNYDIGFDLWAYPETSGVVNYNFTNITFFEYQTTGVVTWYVDSHTIPANDITIGGVPKLWSRSHSNGRFIYFAILRNESGKTWHLPNDFLDFNEGYCYGNITYDAGIII